MVLLLSTGINPQFLIFAEILKNQFTTQQSTYHSTCLLLVCNLNSTPAAMSSEISNITSKAMVAIFQKKFFLLPLPLSFSLRITCDVIKCSSFKMHGALENAKVLYTYIKCSKHSLHICFVYFFAIFFKF